MDKLYYNQIMLVRSLMTIKDEKFNQDPWHIDECEGEQEGGYYIVKFYKKGHLVRRMQFTLKQGEEIRLRMNLWSNSRIINRSGFATLLWNDNIPNKLRRRFEMKAKRGTFTIDEKKKIVNAIEGLLKDIRKSFNI